MRFLRYTVFVIIFIFTFLLLLPKQNLYYALEHKLKKYDVIISNEKFTSNLFGFELDDAKIYAKEVNVASLQNIDVSFGEIDIKSKEIGNSKATLDILNQSIIINFEPTKTFIGKYKIVLKYFKRQRNGVYKYEYKLF